MHQPCIHASPLRPEPHRSAARRQRPHRAVQLAARARRRAARSSCASRTPTSSGRRASRRRRSSRPALARARLGRGARHRRRARAVPPVRAAAPLSVVRARSCSPPARRTTASARPRSSKPSARRRSPTDGRRATPAPAAGCRASRRAARIAAGERPAIRFRVPEDRDVVFTRRRARRRPVPDRRHRRSGHRPRRRHARLQLRRRGRRCADGGDARGARRGSHLEHAAADPAVRGARLHAADLRASVAGDGAGSQPAVEAPRRDVGGRVPRARAICPRRW